MKTEKITTKLENITRYDTSRKGNPRYLVVIDKDTYYTGVDGSMAYSLTNFEGKQVVITWRWLRGKRVIEECELLPIDHEKEAKISYIESQFEKIVTPNLNHIAGTIKIKGDCGGETNCLNVSAKQLEQIRLILCEVE